MTEAIQLRPATLDDAATLLKWRNDDATRTASHHTAAVHEDEHLSWLARTLASPDRRLYVAEEHDLPVGTVRADRSAGSWELSWTVAPEARGRGVAKRMVATLARQIPEPIRAEVKVGNAASARIAEHAGMELERELDGVLHFQRAAL